MIKAVLFDFDDTLVDTLDVDLVLLNEALKKFGYRVQPRSAFIPLRGLPRRENLATLSGEKDEKKVDEMVAYTNTQTHRYPVELAKLEDGAEEMLKDLSGSYPLAVVSSKARERLELILAHFGIGHYFKFIVARGDYTKRKPDPECLLIACGRMKIDPNECVYVGDAEVDIGAARNAGMKVIYYSKKSNTEADATTGSLAKIPSIVARF